MAALGRERLLGVLRRELIGPSGGPGEVLSELPSGRYAAGILYPVGTEFADSPPATLGGDDPLAKSTRYFPSAAGLSFILDGPADLTVELTAARYVPADGEEPDDEDDEPGDGGLPPSHRSARLRWRHVPIDSGSPVHVSAGPGRSETSVLDGHATLHVAGRWSGSRLLVTVAMVNATDAAELPRRPNHLGPSRREISRHCLFGVAFSITPGTRVIPYPPRDIGLRDQEDAEASFQYRGRPVFAVGHGISADWQVDGDRTTLMTQAIPAVLVRSVRYDRPDSDPPAWRLDPHHLEMDRLATTKNLTAVLTPLADAFDAWRSGQASVLADESLAPDAKAVGREILDKQRIASERIRSGISLLGVDPAAGEAFRLANRALADQMRRPGAGRRLARPPAWRPFQLAFALTVLPGLVDPTRADHDVVDLLWFPTGGGKTEAYLFISAFEILRRRLRSGGVDDGVVVLSRYTLRLLTTQQFQRTVAMICALELLRRSDEPRLGTKPMGCGLWVGQEHAPNRFREAMRDWLPRWESGQDRLPIPECPWCGTQIVDDRTKTSGIDASSDHLVLRCLSSTCPFSAPHHIPAQIVDEGLYLERPSIVIGTIDKLAQLPMWGPTQVGLLGGPGRPGPSLVLQDELHLLNGPLGTTASLYEIGLEAVFAAGPGRPKVVASTATIRRAADQAHALFGRDLALFPPNGLTPDDSFFSLTDQRADRARLYVGLMSVGNTWQSSTVYAVTSLAQGVLELPPEDRDPYWTSVIYTNSLQDHGRVSTLIADDVRARLIQLAPAEDAARLIGEVVELRGAGDTATLIDILGRLSRPMGAPGAIDALITTNLIQVGIDIPRLGLILFVGQPKGTAEYIQASSRVGRDEDAPGLIVTVFSHTRARDRSHYEAFRSFHESLYRWVEPMSLTPYSTAALDRLLPAVATIAVRHGSTRRMQPESGASLLRAELDEARLAREAVAARVAWGTTDEQAALLAEFDRLLADWAASAEDEGASFVYSEGGKERVRLLRAFGDRRGMWPVQNSMRSVEPEIPMYLVEPGGGGTDRR